MGFTIRETLQPLFISKGHVTIGKSCTCSLFVLILDFEWAPLDFGWSLADVLKKSKQEAEKKSAEIKEGTDNQKLQTIDEESEEPATQNVTVKDSDDLTDSVENDNKSSEEEKEKDDNWMEIGTWSNEMAQISGDLENEPPNELSMV